MTSLACFQTRSLRPMATFLYPMSVSLPHIPLRDVTVRAPLYYTDPVARISGRNAS